jgi:peptidyl-prolyl cis-trans isomerase D
MLQNIRDNSQGLIAKFIIGLIIIPFALFGIDSLVGGGGQLNVATVNGEDISAAELDRAVELERRRRMNLMGENFDPTLLDEKLIRGPALEQLIRQRLLLQAAETSSVGISGQVVDQTIVAMPQFQEGEQFSVAKYQNVLRSNGYSTAYFKQLMSNDLLINQLNSGVSDSEFITEAELNNIAKIIGEKRTFRYLVIPSSKVESEIILSEDDIDAYYNNNVESFQSEEQLQLSYIELKRENFFKPVSESALMSAYDVEMESYQGTEERRASHILLELGDDRDEAQAIALIEDVKKRLNNGESFADLAVSFSDDLASAQNGGDLGYTTGDTFPKEFENALAELSINGLSEAVKTEAGYHLIKATDIKTTEKPSFAERKDAIERRLQISAAESELVSVVERLKDQVFNSEGLSGPAKELGLEVSTSEYISRSTDQGVLATPQVIAAAFSEDVLEDGNNSEVMELTPDHFIVIAVNDHKPSALQALSEVRDDIVAILTKEKSNSMMKKLGEGVIAQLEDGTSLADIAEKNGYQWQIEQGVTRNSATVDREIIISAFSMSHNTVSNRKLETMSNGDGAVIQLEDIVEGSWQQFSQAEQRSIALELQRNNASQSLNWYLSTLRNNAEITIL